MQSYLILVLQTWIVFESGLISNALPNTLANVRHKLSEQSIHKLLLASIGCELESLCISCKSPYVFKSKTPCPLWMGRFKSTTFHMGTVSNRMS